MTAALWVTVVGFIVTITGSIVVGVLTRNATIRASNAAAETAKTTAATVAASAKSAAEEGAFIRARDLLEAGIDEQDERIKRIADDLQATRLQLGETVRELADARRELAATREEVSILRRSVSQYEGRVIQLTEVLRLHDIDVPPWTLNPSDYGMLPGSIPDPNQPPRTAEVEDADG